MKQGINTALKRTNKIKTFGNSMFPLLMDGDVVYFKKISFTDICVNDIIIFQQDNRYITHRVILKEKTHLITKGDNNLKADVEVYKKDIIGKLDKVKRGNIEFNPEVFYLMQSAVYMKEIIKVKKLLEKNHIDFVFLKGLPLHLYYEKRPPRRIYADCDILVKADNLKQLQKSLHVLGYVTADTSLIQKKKEVVAEISLYKRIKHVVVVFDIHIEPVFMMTQIDVKEYIYPQVLLSKMTHAFLEKKQIITIDSEQYPILRIEFLIVYLALHFFHHNFKGAFRLELIHTIITKVNDKTIWDKVEGVLTEYKLRNFVYPVFLLLKRYYRMPMLARFIQAITPGNLIHRWIGERMVSDAMFNDESRLFGGINRLLLLFLLSPQPMYKKILLVLNKEVVLLFVEIGKKLVKAFFQKLS